MADRPKKLKLVTVDARFHDLRGKADFIGRGRGNNIRIATARAFSDLYKQKGIRKKQLHTITARLSIITVLAEPEKEGRPVEEKAGVGSAQ